MSDKIKTAKQDGTIEETQLTATPMVMGAAQIESISKKLDSIETLKPGLPLQGIYKEFATGEEIRGVFIGFKDIYKDDTKLPCAQWVQSDRRVYLNAGSNLVKQITESEVGIGTPISITLTGTTRTSNKFDVNMFDVRILQTEE